jgi:hypothetical protein
MFVLPLIVVGVAWILIGAESGSGCEVPGTIDDLPVLFILIATAGVGVGLLAFQLARSLALAFAFGIGATVASAVAITFELLYNGGVHGCLA